MTMSGASYATWSSEFGVLAVTTKLTKPDNTNASWWKDPGLRTMMMSMSVVYSASFTFGVRALSRGKRDLALTNKYDGTLLASLIILPQWKEFFNNPTGATMGLIAASFYLRKSCLVSGY